MTSYSFGRDGWMPDDYICECCGRPEEGPHGYPCVDDHDLELLAAEMAEREADCYLAGYDAADAMVTTERWVAGL